MRLAILMLKIVRSKHRQPTVCSGQPAAASPNMQLHAAGAGTRYAFVAAMRLCTAACLVANQHIAPCATPAVTLTCTPEVCLAPPLSDTVKHHQEWREHT